MIIKNISDLLTNDPWPIGAVPEDQMNEELDVLWGNVRRLCDQSDGRYDYDHLSVDELRLLANRAVPAVFEYRASMKPERERQAESRRRASEAQRRRVEEANRRRAEAARKRPERREGAPKRWWKR